MKKSLLLKLTLRKRCDGFVCIIDSSFVKFSRFQTLVASPNRVIRLLMEYSLSLVICFQYISSTLFTSSKSISEFFSSANVLYSLNVIVLQFVFEISKHPRANFLADWLKHWGNSCVSAISIVCELHFFGGSIWRLGKNTFHKSKQSSSN